MMCQCEFMSCKKCATLVGDVDNGGSYALVGGRGIWEISTPFAQFCCKPNTVPKKNKVFKTKHNTLSDPKIKTR